MDALKKHISCSNRLVKVNQIFRFLWNMSARGWGGVGLRKGAEIPTSVGVVMMHQHNYNNKMEKEGFIPKKKVNYVIYHSCSLTL